jgi:hypothetical protein
MKKIINVLLGIVLVSLSSIFVLANTAPSQVTLFNPEDGHNYTSVDVEYSASDADDDPLTYYTYLDDVFYLSSANNISLSGIAEPDPNAHWSASNVLRDAGTTWSTNGIFQDNYLIDNHTPYSDGVDYWMVGYAYYTGGTYAEYTFDSVKTVTSVAMIPFPEGSDGYCIYEVLCDPDGLSGYTVTLMYNDSAPIPPFGFLEVNISMANLNQQCKKLKFSGIPVVQGMCQVYENIAMMKVPVADGTYSLKVSAYDGTDFGDNSSSVSFTIDSTAPVVTVTSIETNETFRDTPLWINFTTDEPAVCTLDNGNWTLFSTTGTSFSFADTSETPDGYYDVKIICADALSNSGTTDILFYSDRTAPYFTYYYPSHVGVTSLYTQGLFQYETQIEDSIGIRYYSVNITRTYDGNVIYFSPMDYDMYELPHPYTVDVILSDWDVSGYENTSYSICVVGCDILNCDSGCTYVDFMQPASPSFALVTPSTPMNVRSGQTISLYALANDSNSVDVLSYRFLIDDVYVGNDYFYDYLVSGNEGDTHSATVEVYDNSPFNYTASYSWNMTLIAGYENTYVKSDLQNIVIDGIGVAGSSFVGNLDLIITLLVVVFGATIVMGFVRKAKK